LIACGGLAVRSKYAGLKAMLARYGEVAVAFSGGVDSTFLLHAACFALGPARVHALHARTPLLAGEESERVRATAQALGCPLTILEVDPFSWPIFVANPPDRCYHCKRKLYRSFLQARDSSRLPLLDGTNLDDLQEVRPGLAALAELGVLIPLAAAGLTKREIRLLSRELGLATWNACSASCLATRIPAGEPISREKIFLVARCEALLTALGFAGVRVRLSGQEATVAVLRPDLERIVKNDVISVIREGFARLGAGRVRIDPQGRPPVPA